MKKLSEKGLRVREVVRICTSSNRRGDVWRECDCLWI